MHPRRSGRTYDRFALSRRLEPGDRNGDDALVGAVLALTSADARQDARIGGRGLLLYASSGRAGGVAPLHEKEQRVNRRRRRCWHAIPTERRASREAAPLGRLRQSPRVCRTADPEQARSRRA
jgi:hypothetical protein